MGDGHTFLELVNQWLSIFIPILSIGLAIAIARSLIERVMQHASSELDEKLKHVEDEKPKHDFVEHGGELLEIVEFEKPKRGDSHDG